MMYSYKTKGTCSRQIDVELDGDVIKDVKFYGGCNGNLRGRSEEHTSELQSPQKSRMPSSA